MTTTGGGPISMSAAAVREGARAGLPLALVTFFVAVSFGVLAAPVLGTVAPIVMSAVLFAGTSQFAVLAILGAGGDVAAAVAAGLLLNLRYAPMGVSLAPFLAGGALRRGLIGQATVDIAWALSRRPDGRLDPGVMLGVSLASYPAWVIGTAVGVLAGEIIGEPTRFGLDVVLPALFLTLIFADARAGRATLAVMLAAIAIAVALTPFTPAGVPVLVACAAALAPVVWPPAERRR